MSVVAVYVPAPSKRNFQIGLRESIWGWKRDTAEKADTPEVLTALKPGDYILFGHRGPNARVPAGIWAGAVLRELAVAQVTGTVYPDESEVWPDDTYPVRVPLEVLDLESAVTGPQLGDAAMEAFRLSANKQGAPVPVADPEVMTRLVDSTEHQADSPEGTSAEPVASPIPWHGPGSGQSQDRYLDLGGNLDRPVLTFARREQARLRREKFNGATSIRCDLCGRTLPAGLVRAAHVRKRSRCNLEQRSHLANLMAACLLGCDALFEDGFIRVSADGIVEVSQKGAASADLLTAAKALEGRHCTAHTPESEGYFDWHRNNSAVLPPTEPVSSAV
ncbi:hypothetical protein GCM10018790_75610 [Kitasatospora xanthocidica]|uniref:hypothetical protein n=1 Tax=Kitasatospora xanthocidica TaxID=83382 RepID=UPI00167C0DD7|nr:hypothetical protein [Kitasatospora xanthocidica]GHF86972.1 hypothetical protein GCM10018790_75610 [Kitasatospora xanthocidica]